MNTDDRKRLLIQDCGDRLNGIMLDLRKYYDETEGKEKHEFNRFFFEITSLERILENWRVKVKDPLIHREWKCKKGV